MDLHVVQLHRVYRGALVLHQEVHPGGQIGGGHPLDYHIVNLSHLALADGLLAQGLDGDELVRQGQQLEILVGDVEGAVAPGNQPVGHGRASVEDRVHNVALGRRSRQALNNTRIGAPLAEAVLVHIGNDLLLNLPLGGAGGSLDVVLVGLVALVDGERPGLLVPHGHLLDGITQLHGGAVPVGTGALVVHQGHGVHAPHPHRAGAGEGVVVAGGAVGQRVLLECLGYLLGEGFR